MQLDCIIYLQHQRSQPASFELGSSRSFLLSLHCHHWTESGIVPVLPFHHLCTGTTSRSMATSIQVHTKHILFIHCLWVQALPDLLVCAWLCCTALTVTSLSLCPCCNHLACYVCGMTAMLSGWRDCQDSLMACGCRHCQTCWGVSAYIAQR